MVAAAVVGIVVVIVDVAIVAVAAAMVVVKLPVESSCEGHIGS